MHEHCPSCGLHFEREPGYWVGAMIVNTTIISATFVLVLVGMTLATFPDVPWGLVFAVTLGVNLLVPIVTYPLSKTIWLALEMSWHPLEPNEVASARARVG